MKYIYIFEDGAFQKSNIAPDSSEIEAIDAGILSIIRVFDQAVLSAEGVWEEMESFE